MTEVMTSYNFHISNDNKNMNKCYYCKKYTTNFSYKKNGKMYKACDCCLDTQRQIRMFKAFIPID